MKISFVLFLGLIEKEAASCKLIKWANGSKDLEQDYDVIICADCLFFDEGRPQLLECLKKALRSGGTAIIVAPSRSGTFEVCTGCIDMKWFFLRG